MPTVAPPRPPIGREIPRAGDRLLEEMARGVVALDAGMGTRLIARGLGPRRDDPCLWNLDHPDEVLAIHLRDAAAGARACFTNTFGANRAWLARWGRRDDEGPINRAGVELARRAVGPSGFVAGDIGPSAADEPGAVAAQAGLLIDAGVDALALETFQLGPAVAALEEIASNLGTVPVPVIVGLWRWPEAVEDAARRLVAAGAGVVGINCRPGIGGALPIVRRLAAAVACPLLVKPGIAPGDPDDVSSPSAFAAAVPELAASRVRLIGGCCGTTEAHVAALADACASLLHPETRPRGGTSP